MKLSLRQFLFFVVVVAILTPIVAVLAYFLYQKPTLENETSKFFQRSITQNSREFLQNFKQACSILNQDIKDSNYTLLEKENKINELKKHIVKFLDADKFSKNFYYWVVELIDEDTSVMRFSNLELREATVIETTENMHLHRDFLSLLARAKNVKKNNGDLNSIRTYKDNPKLFTMYSFVPDFNWLIGVNFDVQNQSLELSSYLETYEQYHIYNLIYFSIFISILISAILFYIISFFSRDLNILQRVLEQLKRGNLTEAKYTFRMLSFDSKAVFTQMNALEMDVLQYINRLNKNLQRTKSLSDKVGEISKHSSELLFDVENSIREQNLSVKQSTIQSDAIVFSANSLNITALNSSRELMEFLKTSESANESLNKLKSSILNLSKASRETSSILEFISGLAVKIKALVLDINKVSENANLVSFNIAIEAEKVGVEGLALSLLSKEIHNVATDTQKLTESITLSAIDLQDTLNADLGDMAKFSMKMQDTNHSLSILAGNLGEIVRGVNLLLQGFESLSSIISEQFKEAHNLSASMISLSNDGEEIGSNISNFRAENESLMQSARELKAKVSEFHF
ncbi:MAG: methyl-accepting chemotaxis protein [Opitutales bacterium]